MEVEYENLGLLNRTLFDSFCKDLPSFLNKGWFILGENVDNFEKEFANFLGSGQFIGVGNGLDALELSLRALGKKKGEVIVPSNTYIATIIAILNSGLTPVLVEPDIETYNIDPSKIEEYVSSNTVAILIVHLYGKCCDMDPIGMIAKKYNLKIIEDCAQAHGSRYKNKMAGTLGHFGAFSFYPTKNLGALGDAGGISVNDPVAGSYLRSVRNYGSSRKYVNDELGVNSRLDEIQAFFLRKKLYLLEKINDHKRALAQIYFESLNDNFILPKLDKDYYDTYHIFNIRIDRRDRLKEYLEKRNIKTEVHYPIPPHKQKALKDYLGGEYPISESIHKTTLSLPISFIHSKDQIYRVIEEMNKF